MISSVSVVSAWVRQVSHTSSAIFTDPSDMARRILQWRNPSPFTRSEDGFPQTKEEEKFKSISILLPLAIR